MGDNVSAELRRYQLFKQGLIERIYHDFYEVANAAIGLHSTDYWTPYISAWARIGDYDAKRVFESLNAGKTIVRRRAFRNTLHIVHIDNYELILSALGPQLERSMRLAPPIKNLSDSELEDRIHEIQQALHDGPLSMNDMKKQLPHIGEQLRWLFLIANARGLIVRTEGSHARSTRLDYDLAERWLGGHDIPHIGEEEALAELIYRYIAHFGPATINDLAWCIPLKMNETREFLQKLGDRIAEVKLDGKKHLIVSEDLEKSKALDIPKEPIINLLPYEDHFPKAFKERTWYLTSELEMVLFPRNREYFWPPEMKPPPPGPPKGINASGEIRPSIWVDGRIVGRWEIETDNDQVAVKHAVVEKVSKDLKERITQICDELSEFINRRLMPIS